MSELLWIVNPDEKFCGNNVNIIALLDDGTYSSVYYQTEPIEFEEFNRQYGGNLLIMSYQELKRDWIQPYYQSLQKPWIETTQEQYHEMLGCVPPLKYRLIAGYNTFFVVECVTGNLYHMYAERELTGKYWYALRCPSATVAQLYEELQALA